MALFEIAAVRIRPLKRAGQYEDDYSMGQWSAQFQWSLDVQRVLYSSLHKVDFRFPDMCQFCCHCNDMQFKLKDTPQFELDILESLDSSWARWKLSIRVRKLENKWNSGTLRTWGVCCFSLSWDFVSLTLLFMEKIQRRLVDIMTYSRINDDNEDRALIPTYNGKVKCI